MYSMCTYRSREQSSVPIVPSWPNLLHHCHPHQLRRTTCAPVENNLLLQQPAPTRSEARAQVPAVRVVHDDAKHVACMSMQEAFPEAHNVWMGQHREQGGFLRSLLCYTDWGAGKGRLARVQSTEGKAGCVLQYDA